MGPYSLNLVLVPQLFVGYLGQMRLAIVTIDDNRLGNSGWMWEGQGKLWGPSCPGIRCFESLSIPESYLGTALNPRASSTWAFTFTPAERQCSWVEEGLTQQFPVSIDRGDCAGVGVGKYINPSQHFGFKDEMSCFAKSSHGCC